MHSSKLAILILGLGFTSLQPACAVERNGETRAAVAVNGTTVDLTQSPWPTIPAAQTARAFIEAYNSGEPERLRAFEATHRASAQLESEPPDERARVWNEHRERWGRFEPLQVVGQTASRISVLVHTAASDARFHLGFDLEPEPPHKLISISIGTAPPPPPVPAKPTGLRR